MTSAARTLRSTPWWKLLLRMRREQRNGHEVRVQMRVGSDWFFLGSRRV